MSIPASFDASRLAMTDALDPQRRRPSAAKASGAAPPAWIAYAAAILLSLTAMASTGLAPYTEPPMRGEPTGVIFSPFSSPAANLAALLAADPGAQVIDMQYGGRIVFIVSDTPDFAARLSKAGAIHFFNAVAAGCHQPVEHMHPAA